MANQTFQLQRFQIASNSWATIYSGTWGECAAEQRVASGYTQIVRTRG